LSQAEAGRGFGQLDRVARLGDIRRTATQTGNEILFRGVQTSVRIKAVSQKRRENRVILENGEIVIQCGPASRTTPARSLENWLRQQARLEIGQKLAIITARPKRQPHRIYVMDQRTKWGNCSRKHNLSFNWRLIMAKPEVLNYIVIHEAARLVEPYHSSKFWLLIRSHCPRFEDTKNWLHANSPRLLAPNKA